MTSVDLPEPETPVTAMKRPTGKSTSMPFRLCIARAAHREPAALVVRAPRRDERCVARPLRNCPGDRARRRPRSSSAVPSATTSPPCSPAPGPRSTTQSADAHHLLVVLDDEHGVADVAQPLERVDEPAVVALVEPDRRLVEDVEHADELRSDLRREPETLRLAARERLRRAVELEVADADVLEEHEPLAHLLQDPPADQLLGLRQLELVDEPQCARHRHLREAVDRAGRRSSRRAPPA